MEVIRALGERLEAAWRAQHYDHAAFPGLARALLEEMAPHRTFDAATLVRWLRQAPEVPRQNVASPFGEPPVTLFAGRRFYLEALFWVDGTTEIHQHGFSGAFQVLAGGSLHTRFVFERTRAPSAQLHFGTLRAASAPELLQPGEAREIGSGAALIHSLFHLDRPSVTLVARTYFDVGAGPQYSYLPPGIAVDRTFTDERLPRLLQLVRMAYKAELPERRTLVAELLDEADLHSALLVAERIAKLAPDEVPALVERLARRDPESAPLLAAAFSEMARQRLVLQWRRQVQAAPHRFLLALLLNVERRDDILRLVAERTGAADPIAQVVAWLGEMSPPDERNPLSYHLGDVELRVLEQLLRGRTVDAVLRALAAEYDDVARQADDVRALCAALPRAALLQPLFR